MYNNIIIAANLFSQLLTYYSSDYKLAAKIS